MSRIAKTLPVSGNLYRHFAVVTVAITVIVALFADGETRASVTDAVESRKSRTAMVEYEANKLGVRRDVLGGLKVRGGGGWGSDTGGGGGDGGGDSWDGSAMAPVGLATGNGEGRILDPLAQRDDSGKAMPKVLPPGMAPADYAPDSAQARRQPKRIGAPKRLSEAAMSSIQNTSRERTGTSEYAEE